MDNNKKKCSLKEHNDIDAISYCYKCKYYLCKNCIYFHKCFFDDNPLRNSNLLIDETFNGFCQENNHNIKLDYFCKNHNKLCCGLCTCKIKGNGNGQHNDCNICFIKDIKAEKKRQLKDNIESLEELSNKFDDTIKKLKIIVEKVNEDKEKLKLEIQKKFTKIRKELNDREDMLLLEVDNYFSRFYNNEDDIKNIDKLPKKIKLSLERGKSIENEWENENKLIFLIHDCINVENYLKEINKINENLKKYEKNKNFNYQFYSNIDKITTRIKNFGILSNFESVILKKSNDINKFFSFIGTRRKLEKINLLYRTSRDGLDYLSIVNKINNKSNLVFLYLTGNERIFGAYIETKLKNIDLNGSRKYYEDENAFVFSLNHNKKYKIVVPQNAIAFDDESIILIGNNRNNNGFWHYNKNTIFDKDLIKNTKIYNFRRNSELTEGNDKLSEIEIFEI